MQVRKNLGVRAAAVALAASSLALALMPAAAQASDDLTAAGTAVAYQGNARHDGNFAGGVAAPPLTRQWSRDLGGSVSYPVIAGGRVFVTAASTTGYGTLLYALDAQTGGDSWGPVPLGGTYWWSALAYGAGRVYAVNYDGVLSAFQASTGAKVWSVQLPGQYAFTSPPTFRQGVVYTGGAGSGGTVYAVNAGTGAVLWTRGVANGDESSPAVNGTGVFVSYACEQTYRLDPGTGAPVWQHSTDCQGGGGRTPVIADGALWIRDDAGKPQTVLNLSDGTVRGTFGTGGWTPAPAFAGRTGFFVAGGVLQARSTRTPLQARWTFTGDNQISTAPIVVDGFVYVGSATGQLWAVDATSGAAVWSDPVGAAIDAPDEHNVSQPLTGLAAGQGRLIVPAGHLLVSYGK
jgi:outer membrane protein assembly factor BamB